MNQPGVINNPSTPLFCYLTTLFLPDYPITRSVRVFKGSFIFINGSFQAVLTGVKRLKIELFELKNGKIIHVTPCYFDTKTIVDFIKDETKKKE